MRSRAAIMLERGRLSVEEIEVDSPGRREVLIRTAFTGVCHTDLHFLQGDYPYPCPCVLGHESSGVVEAVGEDVTYVKPGDHVITCLSTFCGRCNFCLSGRMTLCRSEEMNRQPHERPRLSWHGKPMNQYLRLSSFSELMLVHEHSLTKVRPDMPLDRAALIGCAVVTGAGAVFNTAKVEPGSSVAVLGCGGIGLSAINGAAIAGAGKIIAIDLAKEKLKLASAFGATDVIDAASEDPVERVKVLTELGVDYAFECVGSKKVAEQSFRMLAPGGTATIVGMIPMGTNIELHGAEFLQERRIQGSRMGSNRFRIDMPRLVDFYLRGDLHLDELISDRKPLDAINEAFNELKTGKVARNLIEF